MNYKFEGPKLKIGLSFCEEEEQQELSLSTFSLLMSMLLHASTRWKGGKWITGRQFELATVCDNASL